LVSAKEKNHGTDTNASASNRGTSRSAGSVPRRAHHLCAGYRTRPGTFGHLQPDRLRDPVHRHDHVRTDRHHGHLHAGRCRSQGHCGPRHPRPELRETSNTTAYNYLSANNVSVNWANPVYACTHQKTITVDQATSAILTLNLVTEDYPTSRDFAVITKDPADVAAIETTFNADFANAAITPPTGDNLVWSPTNSRSSLLALLNGATTSLLIAQEEMADTDIENALEAALARSVAVTLIQENLNGKYDSILNAYKSDGANIAVYTTENGYYIHAKVILADYGTPQATLFIGSENFSTDSLNDNRELGLIFNDPTCMAAIQTALTADYNGGTKL